MRTKLTASKESDNAKMIIKLSTSASFYIILCHFRVHCIRRKLGTKQCPQVCSVILFLIKKCGKRKKQSEYVSVFIKK